MKVFTFKNIRIIFLLALLAYAAIYTKEQKLNTRSWFKPVYVTIFPINGDNSIETDLYISTLKDSDFKDIDNFFNHQAERYQLIAEQPIITTLGQAIAAHPPTPPEDRSAILQVIIWSMQLRYWAYKHTPDSLSNTNRIRLYVLYHQANDNRVLDHSLGIQKGLIGIVHAFADTGQNAQNSIVMTHEIFHTVGATDKYDQYNRPIYPDGYADSTQSPLYPQRHAEIMAGRIAVAEHNAKMPISLKDVTVGKKTANEINWIHQP